MPKDIDGFVSWVLKQKPELENVDEAVIAQLARDLTVQLETEMNAAILANLPKDQLPMFEHLLERESSEQIQKFCASHIPNLNEILAAVLTNFKLSYLGA